jgi:hypothetical protein
MLPAGAFAVALFLGGVQIVLPAPAFMEQGRVWAPGRAVLERLGCQVRWDAPSHSLVALRDDQTLRFIEATPPWPVPQTPAEALHARREGDLLYIPLLALRNCGVKAAWDGGARSVRLDAARDVGSSLAAVLADPLAWAGRSVHLTGDYLGWDGDPLCYATAHGPPVSSGDWVLANADGAIYCTPGPAAGAPVRAGLAATTAAPMLTPYHAIGQRLSVSGGIQLARSGVPYLQFDRVAAVVGPAGVSCRLVLDSFQCLPGQSLGFTFVIHNPGPTALRLPTGAPLVLSFAAGGDVVKSLEQSYWRLGIPGFILAGTHTQIRGAWQVPPGTPSGTYSISARLDDVLRSLAVRFEVTAPHAAPGT